MNKVKHLKVPKEWADSLAEIAEKEGLASWCDKARQILKFYLNNRKAVVRSDVMPK